MIPFVVATMVMIGGADLPSEYAWLDSLMGDETRFVEALRTAHKVELARLRMDKSLAEMLTRSGDEKAAADTRARAQARLQTLRNAYETALARFSGNARVHGYFGELLYDGFGDSAGAIAEWNKALSLDSGYAAVHGNLGVHLCGSGQLPLGLQHLDRAIELESDNAVHYFNLAQVYLNAGARAAEARGWEKAKLYKEMLKLSKRAAQLAPNDFELLQDFALMPFAAEKFGAKPDWESSAAAWARARPFARGLNEWFFTRLNEARAWSLAGKNEIARRCLTEGLRFHPGTRASQALMEELKEEDKKK